MGPRGWGHAPDLAVHAPIRPVAIRRGRSVSGPALRGIAPSPGLRGIAPSPGIARRRQPFPVHDSRLRLRA